MARVFRNGTAKQIAEHATGYSANGESHHSRQIAHANVKLGEGKRTNGRLIREQSKALVRLKLKATTEMDPARLEKIRLNIEIKTVFLAKLSGQYSAEHPSEGPWNWQEVVTIAGEDCLRPEAEWFGPDTRKRKMT
jgi:hypothetical protein